MAAKTAKQAAAQERFRAAAKQAKREGKKGKSFAKRVGELLRGRASHGAGHKTTGRAKSAPSSGGHSGGGSMANSKPKPRLAIYAGAAGTAAGALGVLPGRAVPSNVLEAAKLKGGTAAALNNAAAISTDGGTALAVAAPLAVGLGVSWLADKTGFNRMLAKMRAPFRV